MPRLENTPQVYYDKQGTTRRSHFGNYQFISLNEVIDQFMLIYVGEDKIIPKVKRLDVAFHAQRALAELSFDTLKSCKAQSITVPSSLQMVLPQDYIDYTKLSWVDSAGIKHIIYPTDKTSFVPNLTRDDVGRPKYSVTAKLVSVLKNVTSGASIHALKVEGKKLYNLISSAYVAGDRMGTWVNSPALGESKPNHPHVHTFYISGDDTIIIINAGEDAAPESGLQDIISEYPDSNLALNDEIEVTFSSERSGDVTDYTDYKSQITTIPAGHIYFEDSTPGISATGSVADADPYITVSSADDVTDVQVGWYVTATDGINNALQPLTKVTSVVGDQVFVSKGAHTDFTTAYFTFAPIPYNSFASDSKRTEGNLGFVPEDNIRETGEAKSTIWENYKSGTPSENQDDYIDDTYWPANGERYGLDPQHAQANGSFYIDCNGGKIHFSSNLSGKLIILDYISDSLGTEEEMKVHAFAEEAMYKWILHTVLSGKANVPEYQVNRFKKEKFAAVRTAKLRLSSLNIEELTQVLRGKSKWIKH